MASFTQQIEQGRTATRAQLEDARAGYLAALAGDAPNRFHWQGTAFYVDRVRHLIAPEAEIDRAGLAGPTLPADARAVVDHGSVSDPISSEDLIRVMAHLAADRMRALAWAVSGAQLLALAVAQPSVNPAFGSLFWIALADSMRDGVRSAFHDDVRPLMIELATYPASRATAGAVRAAQAEMVARFDASLAQDAGEQSDDRWAATCATVLVAQRAYVDDYVFSEVAALADRIARRSAP